MPSNPSYNGGGRHINTVSSSSDMWIPPMPSPPPTPAPPEAALTTQERLRLAKRRRATQLKRWSQRDREKSAVGGGGQPPDLIPRGVGGVHDRVEFVPNVMLLEASARNDVEEVRRLLRLGVSPDSTNEDGLTALHQCCIDDSEEMMKILIEFGGNPNATDTEKWTPLHAAATCGHLHLVKFLIEHGADLLAVNADGNMPYDLCDDDTTLSYIENEMAKRGVTQDLIDTTRAETERRMLLDLKTCDSSDLFEVRDPTSGATPLHIAAANGYLSVVEFLLDNHVSTEVIDNDQWQPIHAAACWGHLEVVEMLAQNGANISAKTKNGETPFDICEDPEIKERLIQLKEQRVRLEQPRVRRTRSASTRTQSIRRTSLREKMNTTKKDVQDEKLYFIQSFDAIPKTDDQQKHRVPTDNADVVDVNDVELMLPGGPPSSSESPVPKRPPRSNMRESPSPTSLTPSTGSRPLPASSSSSSPSDKINIHVSVTINAPSGSSGSGSSGSPSQQQQPQQLQHHQQLPQLQSPASSTGGTTLADLKKARSMNRSINAYGASAASPPSSSKHAPMPPSSSSFSEQTSSVPREEAPPMAANANNSSSSRHHHSSSSSSRPGHRSSSGHHQHRHGGSSFSPSQEETMGPVIDQGVELHAVGGGSGHKGSSRRKYTATTTELIGPDKKKGCCTII